MGDRGGSRLADGRLSVPRTSTRVLSSHRGLYGGGRERDAPAVTAYRRGVAVLIIRGCVRRRVRPLNVGPLCGADDAPFTIEFVESVERLPSTSRGVSARVRLVDAARRVRRVPAVPSLRVERPTLRGRRTRDVVLPRHRITSLCVSLSALPHAVLSCATALQFAFTSMRALRSPEVVWRRAGGTGGDHITATMGE
jgi:hypothetical protein